MEVGGRRQENIIASTQPFRGASLLCGLTAQLSAASERFYEYASIA